MISNDAVESLVNDPSQRDRLLTELLLQNASSNDHALLTQVEQLLVNAAQLYGLLVIAAEDGDISDIGEDEIGRVSSQITPTSAMVAATALMSMTNLNIFELGMWLEARGGHRPHLANES